MNGHADIHGQTHADICVALGLKADSVRRQFGRIYPELSWDKYAVPTSEQYVRLYGQTRTTRRTYSTGGTTVSISSIPSPNPPADVQETPPGPKTTQAKAINPKVRQRILFALMAIPAAASIQNMYAVSFDIVDQRFAAILFTGLFSAAPFGFVLAGIRSGWTRVLTIALIVYECFSNFARIFGGLTGFEKDGNPTRFLGLVTDVFGSGTHWTGVVLAGIMAAMAAGVFYGAFNELEK